MFTKTCRVLLLFSLLLFGLTFSACERDGGPDRGEEQLSDTVQDAGEKMSDTVESAGENN